MNVLETLNVRKGTFALCAICVGIMASMRMLYPDFPRDPAFQATNLARYMILMPSEFQEHPFSVISLVTNIFIHRDWLLLSTNLAFFFFIGSNLERTIGWKGIIAVFISGGVAGGLTATFMFPAIILGKAFGEVGASPAVFAAAGASLVIWFSAVKNPAVPKFLAAPLAYLLSGFLIGKLISDLFASWSTGLAQDSIYAHLGGLVFGLLFGVAVAAVSRIKQHATAQSTK